jgi:hypothetical protein
MDKRKTESAEIKFLRSVAGFTLPDFYRNTEIWKKYRNMNKKVETQKKNQNEHILRMDKNGFGNRKIQDKRRKRERISKEVIPNVEINNMEHLKQR